MSESVKYVIENIEKSYDIYKTMEQMKHIVLSKLDKSIKDNFNSWLGKDWIFDKDENLFDDDCMSVYPKSLEFKIDADLCSYVSLAFDVEGGQAIWKLFGMPPLDPNDSVTAFLYLGKLADCVWGQEILTYIEKKYSEILREYGFSRGGGKKNPYYKIDITLSNLAVLKAWEDDAWEEALLPIKNAWIRLHEIIDWEDLTSRIHQIATTHSE